MSKFYPLAHEEFMEMRSLLTPAQKDVLLYLRTLDPFGNKKLDIGIRELARDMNLNPSTVSRAMEVLRDKGYIDMETTHVRVQVKSLGALPPHDGVASTQQEACGKVLPTDNSVVSTQQTRSPGNKLDRQATNLIVKQHLASETQSGQSVQNPKIYKTYKTYKDQIDRSVFDLENGNQTEAIAHIDSVGLLKPESEQKLPEQPTNTGESRSSAPDGEREILTFIIRSARQKGAELSNPQGYAKKCLSQNPELWRSLYAGSKRPKQPIKEYTDPWIVESSIAMAIKQGDLVFAKAKIENLRQRGEEALADRLSEKFGGALCR